MIDRALVAAAAALLATGCSAAPAADAGDAAATNSSRTPPLVPAGQRLRVVLMSSLPLVHGDGVDMAAMIAGRRQPHPLYDELQAAHDLVIADALDGKALADADLVILVQPPALSPEALVALDGHVRGGGRLLLFADPLLEWPAGRGMGDLQGPLRTSLISPLLKHWGLELVDPGIDSVRLQSAGAVLVHPGQFATLPGKFGDARCGIITPGYVAHCKVGAGRAVLIADADLIAPNMISNSGDSVAANRRFVASMISDLMTKDTS